MFFGKRDHMAMTFVLDKFHGRVKTIIEMINELIIVLFGIGVLLIGGYAGAMKQMTQADSFFLLQWELSILRFQSQGWQ